MRNVSKILAPAAILFAFLFAACGAASGRKQSAENVPRAEIPIETEETEIPETSEIPAAPETSETPQEGVGAREAKSYLKVLADGLNVRTGPGTAFAVLGQAERGTLLGDAGRNGDWYETFYRGKKAYVSAFERYVERVKLDTGSEKVEKIIEEGVKLLGTPYVYGAVRLHDGRGNFLENFTAAEFDCSSLMQYLFYKGAGILLGVTTRTQVVQGETMAWEELARGDLLFFTNAARQDKTGVERVGHVALWLGGGYILHTASDYAKIEQITPLRRSRFLEGRRFSLT